MAFYTPNSIATRPVTGTDSPYVIPIGVVTTYDPVLNGALTLQFPAAPVDGSIVIVKNATADPTPITLDPNGNTFEAPDTSDTAYLTTGTVSHSAPKQSYRWIFDGTDTWWIDHGYKPSEARTVITTGDYTPKRPGEIILADASTLSSDLTITIPAGWPVDSQFTVVKTSSDDYQVGVQFSGAETCQPTRNPTNTYPNAEFLDEQSDCITYVKGSTNVWNVKTHALAPYSEIWIVQEDTNIPEIEAPAPLTFVSNTAGGTSSVLFDDPPAVSGVLTAAVSFEGTFNVQAIAWLDLASNNSTGRIRILPASSGSLLSFPMWTGAAVPRAEFIPASITSGNALALAAGQTLQFNMRFDDQAGTGNSAQLGSSVAGDDYGMLVLFEL